jgi:hypothetical protein
MSSMLALIADAPLLTVVGVVPVPELVHVSALEPELATTQVFEVVSHCRPVPQQFVALQVLPNPFAWPDTVVAHTFL